MLLLWHFPLVFVLEKCLFAIYRILYIRSFFFVFTLPVHSDVDVSKYIFLTVAFRTFFYFQESRSPGVDYCSGCMYVKYWCFFVLFFFSFSWLWALTINVSVPFMHHDLITRSGTKKHTGISWGLASPLFFPPPKNTTTLIPIQMMGPELQ